MTKSNVIYTSRPVTLFKGYIHDIIIDIRSNESVRNSFKLSENMEIK